MCCVLTQCVLCRYNHHGWLGIKKQFSLSLSLSLSLYLFDREVQRCTHWLGINKRIIYLFDREIQRCMQWLGIDKRIICLFDREIQRCTQWLGINKRIIYLSLTEKCSIAHSHDGVLVLRKKYLSLCLTEKYSVARNDWALTKELTISLSDRNTVLHTVTWH